MWSDDRSFLSDFGKFYTESKAKLYDWISDFVGIMRSGKLVSHASVWRKMHGDRWDYHDCYSTIPKYVDTYCTYSRPLHFTGNLFLSVLPQDNFIIMLFHFTFNQRVICPLIFSSFIQRNYRWQVVYILFMQCMVFVCVIWSFDEMGLREQVILSDKGNRETEQIINIGKVIIFWNRDGRMFYVKDYRLCFFIYKKHSGHQEKT